MKARIVLIFLALLLVSVSVIAADGNTALGNVTLVSQELHSSTLVNVKFNVDIHSYPSVETTGPPEAYRGFYEIYTETSEEGSTGGIYRAIVGRFYKTESYPQTKSVVFGYENGILGGELIRPGKHYKIDFYFQEYTWASGTYDYSKFFIKTIEFDSLPYSEPKECSADSECMWCGSSCVKSSPSPICIAVLPPAGYDCVCQGAKCTEVALGEKPDLAARGFSFENGMVVGKQYSLKGKAENMSSIDVNAFNIDWFEVSPATNEVETNEMEGQYGTERFKNLGGNMGVEREVQIKFTKAGYYTIGIKVDSMNEIDESDETNNNSIITIYVSEGKPDLIIKDITFGAIPESDKAISFKVCNIGSADIKSEFDMKFKDSSISIVIHPHVSPSNLPEGSLQAGKCMDVGVQWADAWGSYYGSHKTTATVDEFNAIDESDETNNQLAEFNYVEEGLEKIYASLDEEFRLQRGQVAIIESENLEIQVESIIYVAPYCTPGEGCEGNVDVVMITVKQNDAISSMTLNEGERTKVFGLEITNIAIGKETASFIVSKENTPNAVYAYLNESFKLIEDQVGVVQEEDRYIMKVIIESVIHEDVVCGAGNEEIIGTCRSIEYAQISVSIVGGGAHNFTLAAGSSKEAGSYKVSLLALSKEATGWVGTLIVENVVEPKSIVVKLDEKFQLIEGGSAIVEETTLKLVLLELSEDTAVFEVYAPVSAAISGSGSTGETGTVTATVGTITETSGSSSTGETGTVWTTTTVTETVDEKTSRIIAEVEETIKTKDVLYQPIIKIRVGSEAEIYGHVVGFEELAPTLLVAKSYPLVGVFVVSKKALPDEKKAMLNEKFSLIHDQTAVVYKSDDTYPRAIEQEIMRIKMLGILSSLCAVPVEGEKIICDGRDVVSIIVTSSEPVPLGGRGINQNIDLREGEAKQFGRYSIRLLDIEGAEAVFIVKEVAVGAIEVNLDEYFDLEINQTALVIGEDITIVLSSVGQGICQLIEPPICWAGSVEVGIGKELEEFDYGSEIGIYKLKENESVSIYGVEVKLVKVGENAATFIVSGGNQAVINVHVGKLFKLKEQQAARVLEANIRVDLLSIMYPVCMLENECKLPMAEFSVSNYLYTEKEIGKKIARRVYETTAVQEAVSERISSSDAVSSASMPPAPFSTYRLSAGESVVVGDYEIKVNSIEYGAVEFIVAEKGGEERFEIKIYKGWTLFSMPGELIVESSSGCNTSEWVVVEYVKETNSFRKVIEPEAGKAYWIYNPGEACSAKVRLRASFPLNKIPELTKGWNFVPVVLEMDGKKLNDLGNCKIKGAYFYDSVVRNWASALGEITTKDIGKGIAVYVEETCSLGGELTPPPLPPIGAECEADSQCEVYYSHCSCSWETDVIKEPREDCERICPNENMQIKPYAACVEGACEKKYECPAAKSIDCMPIATDDTPIATNKGCGDRHYLDYVQKYCGVEITW